MNILLGEKIRKRRKELKMRQYELAGDDFTVSFISQIEQGKMRPSLSSLEKLSAKLGLTISYLLSGDSSTGTTDINSSIFVNITSYILEIRTTFLQSNFLAALNKLDNLRLELKKTGNDELLMYCDYYRAKAMFKLDRNSECAELLESIQNNIELQKTADVFADIHYMLGTLCNDKSKYNNARKHLTQAKTTIIDNSLAMTDILKRCITNLISACGEANDFIKAYDLAKELFEFSQKHNFYEGTGLALLQIGSCLMESGKSDALEYLTKASTLFKIVEDNAKYAHSEFSLGSYHYINHAPAIAIKHFNIAIKLLREQDNNPRILAQIYCEKAQAHMQLSEITEALNLCHIAMKISKEHDLQPILARVYDIIGQILITRNKKNWAIRSLLIAEKLFLDNGSHNELPKLYSNLSELYMDMGDITSARKNLHKLNSVTK